MPFRIRDLVVSVQRPGMPRDCDAGCSRIQCSEFPEPSRGVVRACDAGCSRIQCSEFPEPSRGLVGACDAGCTRIQCSEFPEPSRSMIGPQLDAIRSAELALLKAEMRLALHRLDPLAPAPPAVPAPVPAPPVVEVPIESATIEEIDLVEKQLQEALKRLGEQRARLKKG